MSAIKARFVPSEVENPFFSDKEKEVPYEKARKAREEIMKILVSHGFSIRQAAITLDMIKDSFLDRPLGIKTTTE